LIEKAETTPSNTSSPLVVPQSSLNEEDEFILPEDVKQWMTACTKIFIDTPCEQPTYRCYDKVICFACAVTCTLKLHSSSSSSFSLTNENSSNSL
jgi:hypothetical protein